MAKEGKFPKPSSLSRFVIERIRPAVNRWLVRWQIPEDIYIIASAILVGCGTSLGAVFFVWLLHHVRLASVMARYLLGPVTGTLLIMGAAGVLVGLIVQYWAREARASGIPDVMEAVAIRGGHMRVRVAEARIIATSLTIGSGGSAGSEGPIVQVGASIGSSLGQLFHFSEERMRTLVACGAAAGIAAAFNAPIAGTIFAMEVILNSFNVRYFGAVVVSAVASSIVSRTLLGNRLTFEVPAYPLNHLGEIPIYVVLGLLSALFAVFFIRFFIVGERLFERLPLPLPARMGIGMVLTGVIGLTLPNRDVLATGIDLIGDTIARDVDSPIWFLVVLLLLKVVATTLTVGSGNSGGVFAPSLFMGALLGGTIGNVAHMLWPDVAANPGAYAIVGMAAVFAGAARGPITALLIVFEMSGDYQLILPLMMATVLSTLVAEGIQDESIYTYKLKQRGITLHRGRDVDIMQSVHVEEVMDTEIQTISPDTTLHEFSDILMQTHSHGFPVVNDQNQLLGIVTLTDLDRALVNHLPNETTVGTIGTDRSHLLVATIDETMGEALAKMGTRGLGRLPVVDAKDPNRLLGLIEREDIIRAYDLALTRRAELQHRAKHMQLRNLDGTEFIDIKLRQGDMAVGQALSSVASSIPKECILVSIRRNGKVLIPHGDTVFRAGDRVTVFVENKHTETIRKTLCRQQELL